MRTSSGNCPNRKPKVVGLTLIGLALALLSAGPGGRTQEETHAALLTVAGPIGPAVADYLHRGLERAHADGATVVVLQMDTPGGLDTSMRAIIQDILASPIPVIGFVGPSGSRAASAGTYMLYATHVAAMAPATNLGAATPVQLGGGESSPLPLPGGGEKPQQRKPSDGNGGSKVGDQTELGSPAEGQARPSDQSAQERTSTPAKRKPSLEDKVLQDAVAYIRSLAQKRGRNVEWAEKAVTEAASLSAADAFKEGVIDLIADNVPDLLKKVDGRTVEIGGKDIVLHTAGLRIVPIPPDWRTEFLEIITDPTVAYLLLFTIGVPALLIEFYTGTLIAGVIGAICIVLGLYGLHVLPIDYAGAGLILLGLALLVAEAFIPSFGALGLGGVAAFVIGSVMLIDTDVPGYGISPWAIGSIAAVAGAIMLLIIWVIIRSRSQAPVTGSEAMLGAPGVVLDWSDGVGHVRFQGEVWSARSEDRDLEAGSAIHIVGRDGLVLDVAASEPAEETS